jgi:NADH-quinone oxidoreductase subunit N
MATVLKICLAASWSPTVFVYAKDYLREPGPVQGGVLRAGLFATLGMMVMISANSLLTVYLGLELLALCCTPWWPSTAIRSAGPRRR